VSVGSVQDLLGARTPGVQFTRISGNVGTGAPLEIRGTGSFTLGSNPLIYVDGIRVNNNYRAGPVIGQGRQVNVLNDFNPADIESIEIIKGPAAATLYGTEASAGVVQIITKRGAQGAPLFEASVRQGINFLRDPAGRIGTMWTCRNSALPPCREDTGLIPYSPYQEGNLLLHEGTLNASEFAPEPFPEQTLFQTGPSQSYTLGARGGTEALRYFISGNYDYDEGMEYWNSNETLRLRANVSVIFNPNVTLDASMGYADGFTVFGQQVRNDGGIWEDLIWGTGYCLPRINGKNACPRLLGFQEHLPTDIQRTRVTRDFNRFTGSATLNLTPFDWLAGRATVGLDQGSDENTALYPREIVQPVFFRMPTGEITVGRPKNTNVSLDVSATANFTLTDAIGTSTSAGVQYNSKVESDFEITGINFASPVATTVNQTPAALSTNRYTFVENKSLGAYVQEQVSWNNRVFVTAAVRFDDNSAFGSSLDPEIYPKFAATWVISEEGFWNIDAISSLRLRTAWGQAGRQPNAFARVTRYNVGAGPFGTTAFTPAGPGNDEVGPEKGTELEYGFDIALLEGRISGEFTAFQKKTEDALLSIALPQSLGLAGSIQRNLGQIDNWGWEASLNTELYNSPDLALSVAFTGSHVDNEIKSLGNYPGNNQIRIGYPYPNYPAPRWVIVDAKWDPAGAKVNAYGQRVSARCDAGVRLGPTTQYGLVPGGELIDCERKDIERLLYGRAFYTHRFSITPTLSLFSSALQLHVLADGAYGKVNDESKSSSFGYDNQRVTRVEDDPLYVAVDRYGVTATMHKTDFWKLREIGVRYNLPETLTQRFGADRASLAFSAREVGILWRAQETAWGAQITDPEQADPDPGAGENNRVSPPLSNLSVELRVTF
jgi:TonB-dependent SusC/RagA subfamily outer membrane receptor